MLARLKSSQMEGFQNGFCENFGLGVLAVRVPGGLNRRRHHASISHHCVWVTARPKGLMMIKQFCLFFLPPCTCHTVHCWLAWAGRPLLCQMGSYFLAWFTFLFLFGAIRLFCFKTLLNEDFFFFFVPCLVESHLAFIGYLFCFSHTAISLSAPQSISPTRCVMADTALESIPSLVTMATTTFFFLLCFFFFTTVSFLCSCLFANSFFSQPNLRLWKGRLKTDKEIRSVWKAESVVWCDRRAP